MKPSATMRIPRREEPYVTDEMKQRWTRDVLPKYETRLGALMPLLHDIQHEYRHIPYQAMEEVAEFLDLHPGDVLDCVSFYEEFHTEPVGRYVIGVCRSIACEFSACTCNDLVDHVRNKYDVEPNETSDDGKVTLMALECLGSCDTAPVALVNDKLHENLTVEKLDQILESLE